MPIEKSTPTKLVANNLSHDETIELEKILTEALCNIKYISVSNFNLSLIEFSLKTNKSIQSLDLLSLELTEENVSTLANILKENSEIKRLRLNSGITEQHLKIILDAIHVNGNSHLFKPDDNNLDRIYIELGNESESEIDLRDIDRLLDMIEGYQPLINDVNIVIDIEKINLALRTRLAKLGLIFFPDNQGHGEFYDITEHYTRSLPLIRFFTLGSKGKILKHEKFLLTPVYETYSQVRKNIKEFVNTNVVVVEEIVSALLTEIEDITVNFSNKNGVAELDKHKVNLQELIKISCEDAKNRCLALGFNSNHNIEQIVKTKEQQIEALYHKRLLELVPEEKSQVSILDNDQVPHAAFNLKELLIKPAPAIGGGENATQKSQHVMSFDNSPNAQAPISLCHEDFNTKSANTPTKPTSDTYSGEKKALQLLNPLKDKMKEETDPKRKEAIKIMISALAKAISSYYQDKNFDFGNAFNSAIDTAKPVLEQQSGWKKMIDSVANAIINFLWSNTAETTQSNSGKRFSFFANPNPVVKEIDQAKEKLQLMLI